MGKKSPKAPAAPDYTNLAYQQANLQNQAAQQTAKYQNPNISTAYGGQSVTYDASGTPTVTQALSAPEQSKLNAQNQVQQSLANLGVDLSGNLGRYSTPFMYTGPQTVTDIGGYKPAEYAINRQDVQSGIDTSNLAQMPVNAGTTAQEAILSRLAPQLERQRNAQTQQLANQGITSGSEAWRNAQTDIGQQQNDLITQAALQGINLDMAARQQGLGEQLSLADLYNQAQQTDYGQQMGIQGLYNAAQNQDYTQALGRAQFQNAAANQELQKQLALRQQPLNELKGLMSGVEVNNPNFQPYQGATATAPNLMGAATSQYANAMDLYNAQVNSQNALTSGLFGLGGAALGGMLGGGAGSFGAQLGNKIFGK